MQHGGFRSYGVDAELAKKTGSNLEADNLVVELEMENENGSGQGTWLEVLGFS